MAEENRNRMAEQCGMPPVPYDGAQLYLDRDQAELRDTSHRTFQSPGRASLGTRTSANRSRSGFNLRGVIEVLEEHGVDPIVEIVKVLKRTKPVFSRDGSPVLLPSGEQMREPVLSADVTARVGLELANFVHPKLKSVEMKIKEPELTPEQVDRRLAALLSRSQNRALD